MRSIVQVGCRKDLMTTLDAGDRPVTAGASDKALAKVLILTSREIPARVHVQQPFYTTWQIEQQDQHNGALALSASCLRRMKKPLLSHLVSEEEL